MSHPATQATLDEIAAKRKYLNNEVGREAFRIDWTNSEVIRLVWHFRDGSSDEIGKLPRSLARWPQAILACIKAVRFGIDAAHEAKGFKSEVEVPEAITATLPPGYHFQGIYRKTNNEDCMGRQEPDYWTADIRSPDGKQIFMGNDDSKEAAAVKAVQAARKDYDFKAQSPGARLTALVLNAEKQGRFYDQDLVDAIGIIARGAGFAGSFPNEDAARPEAKA